MSKKPFTDSEARKKLGELTTYSYSLFLRQQDRPPAPNISDIVSKKGLRKDGRSLIDHRKLYMKCGVVESARGSSYVEMGGTKVIAAVTGPVEMPQTLESEEKGFLNCEVKFSHFSCKTRDEEEELGTEIETVTDGLNRALEPAVIKEELGNVQLNVIVTVVESDGSVVSACVVAASLAIANGRIPMSDLVSSSTIAILPNDLKLIDPTMMEEEYALTQFKGSHSHGVINLSYMHSSHQVADFVLSGKLEVEAVLPSMNILKDQCSKIYARMQDILKRDVRQIVDVITSKNRPEVEQESTNAVREELSKLSTRT